MRIFTFIRNSVLLLVLFITGCNNNDNVTDPEEIQTHTYVVEKDIIWASPKGIDLTMDIYIPEAGKTIYPVLIIFHGGSWLYNNKSVMNDMSEYIAEHSGYIVCNVNYRLLTANGNTTTMNEMIEDVFGAVLWVKENIAAYKGDPARIAITGDSAGGHLAAMIILNGDKLRSYGFSGTPAGFNPTYLPEGKTAEEIAGERGLEVQAAILNYAPYDIYTICLYGFETSNIFWSIAGAQPRGIFGDSINVNDDPGYYYAVSPLYIIPESTDRKLPPQLCTVGSKDNVVTPTSVKAYVDALQKAGQTVEYWEYEGKPHAYLDSGSNQFLGTNFDEDAPEALNKMISFLNTVL